MYILADLFNPISEEDYKNKGVRLLPSRVSGEAATIQRVFDELSLDVLIPAVNGIVTTLNGLGIDGRVSSTDIKGIRLNSDNVIEITLNGSNWIAVSDPKGSVDNLNSNLTSYIDNVETRLEDKKANKTDVLSKNNEDIFEPVGQYNPATKKYVDDAVFNSGAADMTKAVYDTTGKNTDIFVYADEASKIADESGNTYRLAIDNNGLYLYPSELPNDKNYLPKESTLQDVLRINNGIDSKIGTSGQNNNTTLFGLLNRGMVKSVQSGTIGSEIQLTEVDREFDSTYYKDFTISTVNVNKSLLFVDSETTSDDHRITGKILNNSTIRIYGYNSIRGGSIYKLSRTIWHVIEFY